MALGNETISNLVGFSICAVTLAVWLHIRETARRASIAACLRTGGHDFRVITAYGFSTRVCRRCPYQEPVT